MKLIKLRCSSPRKELPWSINITFGTLVRYSTSTNAPKKRGTKVSSDLVCKTSLIWLRIFLLSWLALQRPDRAATVQSPFANLPLAAPAVAKTSMQVTAGYLCWPLGEAVRALP